MRNLRKIVLAALISGGLYACSGGGDDCEADEQIGCSIMTASQNSFTQNEEVGALPICMTASDSDGDGFGFENGESCIAPSLPEQVVEASIDEINHVVVVTGQSNVEAPETAFDPVLDQPHRRVFAFTDSGWQIADLHQVWDENAHPGNHSLTDPTRSPNNNFGFHYGKSLASFDKTKVPAFIVLAAPGKGISNWDYNSPFYEKMRNKITSALEQIPHRNTIDVMLWHQGESDWLFEGTSDPFATVYNDKETSEYKIYYKLKLDEVIANFRSEPWAAPDLPFICGETRIAEGVNRHLAALNNNGDENSACVATSDLPFTPTDPTGNHFSAAGLRELGRRYMQKYVEISTR